MTLSKFLLLPCLVLSVAACSTTPPGGTSPCTGDTPLSGCGNRCTPSTPCATGLYCAESGRCGADCDYAAQTGCNAGFTCSLTGQCVSGSDGGIVVPTDGPLPDNNCANIALNTNHTTPNVILILDRSQSMDQDFGRDSRWNVLRDTLMSTPSGLVNTLQSSVRFGLVTYAGFSSGGATCPALQIVDPALNNYDAIDAVYTRNGTIPGTPTGEALEAVIANSALSMSTPDPTVFVLATDGDPNGCAGIDVMGKPRSLAAVQSAYSMGIRTYVIGVGTASELDGDHLTDLANAGIGAAASASSMYWRVADEASLIAALTTIVGGTISCDIALTSGSIDITDPTAYCAGADVQLNGNPVPCETADGWHAVDATHIRLQGTSCDELTATGGTVTASFPCGIVLF